MFEKEAEELIEESKRLNTTPRETVCKAIEFGYNKALEDTETMLKVLKDRGVISSWYYNGSYHVGNELPR